MRLREEEEEKKWGDEEREMVVKLVSSLRHSEEDGGNEFIRPPQFWGPVSMCGSLSRFAALRLPERER